MRGGHDFSVGVGVGVDSAAPWWCHQFPSVSSTDRKAIFFNSHNVSKPESSSDLTSVRLRPLCLVSLSSDVFVCLTSCQRENVEGVSQPPSDDVIGELSRSLRRALGVSLFGIDVIINNQTGQHAVIDINAFPGRWPPPPPPPESSRSHTAAHPTVSTGYEGVPEFFNDLLTHISSVLQSHSAASGAAVTAAAAPPDSPWIVEGDGGLKGARQRLGCNSAVSPNFQQHCVSTIATKASSQ